MAIVTINSSSSSSSSSHHYYIPRNKNSGANNRGR